MRAGGRDDHPAEDRAGLHTGDRIGGNAFVRSLQRYLRQQARPARQSVHAQAQTRKDGAALAKMFLYGMGSETVEREFLISRAVYEAGIPCPEPVRLITDGERFGAEYEIIANKRSYTRIISEEPEQLEPLTLKFVKLGKKLHSTPANTDVFPDMKDVIRPWIEKSTCLSDPLRGRLLSALDSIPSSKTYNRAYGRGSWNSTTVISLSIGQGEILATPMHLANLCATIANRGHYYIPHIIKASEGVEIDERFTQPQYTMVDTLQFPKVIKGMWRAVNSGPGMGGTAAIAHVDSLDICGKTGTAQNPRGADNSVFICFAPMDHPKIAIAAYVENGGFGATYAAPIASLMVEQYLKGETSRPWLEERMKEANLMSRVKHD